LDGFEFFQLIGIGIEDRYFAHAAILPFP
jgi:hypothetical protein